MFSLAPHVFVTPAPGMKHVQEDTSICPMRRVVTTLREVHMPKAWIKLSKISIGHSLY